MKSKTKLLAGILAAIFVAVVGITITLIVTGIRSGDQQTIVRNEADLREAVTEESDKNIVLDGDVNVDGDLEMTQLRNFDLNGHILTVKGTFSVTSTKTGTLWFGSDGEGSSAGGTLVASKVNIDASGAHIDWNADVKLSGSGAGAFTVKTSANTFVLSGKFVGADNKTVAAPELTIKGGSLQLAADVPAVTYTVHVDADNVKIENKTTAGGVVVETAKSVTVGGDITVNGSSAAVVVTANASSSVTVKGTVGSVSAKDADVVVDAAATAGSVEAKSVVNKGTVEEIKATGEVKNEEGATIGKVTESGSVVNNGTVNESVKSSGKVENAGEVKGDVEAEDVDNKENASIGGDIDASGSVNNDGKVDGGVSAGEVTGDGDIGGDVTIDEKTVVTVPVVSDTTFTYNGAAQGIDIAADDGYTITGTQKNTDVGTYTVTVTLKTGFIWSDGSETAKTFTYTINKAHNAWTREYSTADYTYGTNPTTTTATVKFATTVTVKYYSDAARTQEVSGMTAFTSSTEAGTYYVRVTAAGTTNFNVLSKDYTVVVAQAEVDKPTLETDTFVYNGASHTVFTAPSGAKYTVSGDTRKSGAGSYTVTFSLKDGANYKWKDGNSAAFSLSWTISQLRNTWTSSTKTQDYTYGQTPIAANFKAALGTAVTYYYSDAEYQNEIVSMLRFSDTTAAGTYYVKVTVAGNSDYSGLEEKYSVTVSPKSIAVPEVSGTEFTYNGNEQGISIAENAGYTIAGALKNKNAGTYTVTLTLKANYAWTGGSTEAKSYEYTISKAKVTAPDFEDGKTLPYNGAEQKVFDVSADALYKVTDYAGKEVGKYTMKFELNDTANYVWDDNTFAAKEYAWEIVPGTATVTSEAELNAAIADSGYNVVKLGADFAVTETVIVEREVTLDLSGKTVTVNAGFDGVAFRVNEGGDLTITGNGTIDATAANEKLVAVGAMGGKVTIMSGTIKVDTAEESAVYAMYGGTVEIYGGTIANVCTEEYAYGGGKPLTLNNSNDKPGTITVYGGTFIGRNPADGDDNLGGSFVFNERKVAVYVGVKYVITEEVPADADYVTDYEGNNAEVYTAKGLVEAITVTDSVKLMADVTESIVIPADKTLALDLNGFTLTNKAGEHTIINNGTLTITDGSEAKTGTVDNVSHAKAAIVNNVGGTVTVENGNFTRSKENGIDKEQSGGNSFYVVQNFGDMIINDGKVTQNGHFSSMITNGWYDGVKDNTAGNVAKMTINGGDFSGGLNTIKNDDYGELTINGGTFTSFSQAAVFNVNVLTITGTKNVVIDGAEAEQAIYTRWYNDTFDKGIVNVSGGKIVGALSAFGEKAAYNISGTPDLSKATGYVCNEQILKSFIAAGIKNLVLECDFAVTETVIVEREVTLDLSGKTITNNGLGLAFHVSGADAKLTLNDESNAGGIYGGSGGNNMALRVDAGATVDIYGGNYSVGADADGLGNSCLECGSKAGNGNLNIYGGKFSTEAAYNNWYFVLNLVQTQGADGTITVYGGEFINYNPAKGDDNLGGNFVADGYKVAYIDATKSYEVVKSEAEYTGADIVYNYTADGIVAEAFTAVGLKMASAEAQTVKLMAAITGDVTIGEAQTVTLDLNGQTLTGKIVNNGELTLTDGSANASGKVVGTQDHTVYNKGTLTVENGTFDAQMHEKAALYNEGTATLNGGTFVRSKEAGTRLPSSSNNGNSYYYIYNRGVMTVGEGVVVAGKSAASSAINNNGTKHADGSISYAEMTINGGTFSSYGITLKNDDYGKLTVNGGEFSVKADTAINDNGGSEVLLNWAQATITGGTFKSELRGESDKIVYNSAYLLDGKSENNLTIGVAAEISAGQGGTAIYSESYDGKAAPVLNVDGGTIEGLVVVKNGEAKIDGGNFTSVGRQVLYMDSASAEITGGTFGFTRNDTLVGKKQTNMVQMHKSTLTIGGGTFTSDCYGFTVLDNSSFEYGGSASTETKWPAISGNNYNPTMNVTVTGGSLTAADDAAIYMPSAGNLTITGGVITGASAIDARLGTIKIGGTATLVATKTDWTQLKKEQIGGTTVADGSAVTLHTELYETNTADAATLTLTIENAAEISAASGRLITVYDWNQVEQTCTLNFGTFADDAKYYAYSDGSLIETDSEGTALVADAAIKIIRAAAAVTGAGDRSYEHQDYDDYGVATEKVTYTYTLLEMPDITITEDIKYDLSDYTQANNVVVKLGSGENVYYIVIGDPMFTIDYPIDFDIGNISLMLPNLE